MCFVLIYGLKLIYIMLILIETPAGFALFQVANTKALNKIENIYDYLQNEKQAKKLYISYLL